MSTTVTETATKAGESLVTSLNAIFLAIGNAYYEANKSLSNGGTTNGIGSTGSSSGGSGNGNGIGGSKLSLSAMGEECHSRIKASRAAFLDSLDQLDIMVLRATEVLQRSARQKQANFLVSNDKASSDAVLVNTNTNTNAIAATENLNHMTNDNTTIAADAKEQGPSPETMLLSGEGLIPAANNDGIDIGISGAPDFSTTEQLSGDATNGSGGGGDIDSMVPADQSSTQPGGAPQTNGDIGSLSIPDHNASLDNNPNSATKPPDEEMMDFDGPIDFGDMVFDFNLDDTAHFDFGAMIDAD